MDDIRHRADGVRDYIMTNLSVEEIDSIGYDNDAGIQAQLRINDLLNQLMGVGNMKHLYIAKIDETGAIYTSMGDPAQSADPYVPSGKLAEDLRESLNERVQITGRHIYKTEHGGVYSIFWPVLNTDYSIIGVICMEFDVDDIYNSYNRVAVYSLSLSITLIIMFSIIAYISMSAATEPIYKKLAYTDLLTGCENRMAFERSLRDANAHADHGKSVAMMIFDVNNLKAVNDNLGHKLGDIYLTSTADIIKKHLGPSVPLYRIGGDEFAAIFIDTGENIILGILDALHNEKSFAFKNLPFSCACGAAVFDRKYDNNLRDLFARADQAMYQEKLRQKGKPR